MFINHEPIYIHFDVFIIIKFPFSFFFFNSSGDLSGPRDGGGDGGGISEKWWGEICGDMILNIVTPNMYVNVSSTYITILHFSFMNITFSTRYKKLI